MVDGICKDFRTHIPQKEKYSHYHLAYLPANICCSFTKEIVVLFMMQLNRPRNNLHDS